MTTITSPAKLVNAASTGIARPSRYLIEFSLPPGPSGEKAEIVAPIVQQMPRLDSSINADNRIGLLCHTTSLPQRSLSTTELKQYGPPHKIAHSQAYDTFSCTFYASPQHLERKYFEAWQRAAVNVRSNTMNFYKEYISDIYVSQLSLDGKQSYTVVLREAYPLTIGIVDLSYSNMNNVTNVTVTFTYRYWESILDRSTDASTLFVANAGTLKDMFQGLIGGAGNFLSGLGDALGGIGDSIGDAFGGIGGAFDGITGAVGDVMDGIGNVGDTIEGVVDGVSGVIDQGVGVIDQVTGIADDVDDFFNDFEDTVSGAIDGVIDSVTDPIDRITDSVEGTIGSVTDTIDGIGDSVSDLGDAIDDVTDLFG